MLRRIINSDPSLQKGHFQKQKTTNSPYSKDPITLKSQSQNIPLAQNRKFNIREARKVRENFQRRLQSHYKRSNSKSRFQSARYGKRQQKQCNILKTMDIWYQQRLKGIQCYNKQYMIRMLQQLSGQSSILDLSHCQNLICKINNACDKELEQNIKICLV